MHELSSTPTVCPGPLTPSQLSARPSPQSHRWPVSTPRLHFTGGIGEHAAPVRERICAGLEFLGIRLDPRRNVDHAPFISHDSARATVRVMKADEGLMIARQTDRLIAQRGAHDVSV